LIEQSPKMAYKLRFRPLETLGAQGWQTVETSA
jgi:arginyl-tRNA--protein-N-Asp/Glu arginylyltransferase